MEKNKNITFKDLGVMEELCEACESLNWKYPTAIQKEAIPVSLQGKDVIGLAETGSGKTGAFGLPLLQALIGQPQRFFALVLTPTRELAFQVKEQLEALGSMIGLKCCALIGGLDMPQQAIALAKRPHVIVATPGRLVDHLEKTRGFNLNTLKFLVMDEADRILNMDYEEDIDKIIKVIPKKRRTMLFSATMTSKVEKLQRAYLRDPVRVEVSSKYHTVDKLLQYMLFIPFKFKNVYLTYILTEIGSTSVIIFCATQAAVQKTAFLLRNLGFNAFPLHGKMNQMSRLGALNKFKGKSNSILIATDVASRGLDIPDVDYVINYDVPLQSKDYIHRVGRTARAGNTGTAITIVSQYEVEIYQRIEGVLSKKLPVYPTVQEEAMVLLDRVAEAERIAKLDMKNVNLKTGKNVKGLKRTAGAALNEDGEQGSFAIKRNLGTHRKKFTKKRKNK